VSVSGYLCYYLMESTNWLASAQPFSTPQSLPVVAEDPGVALYNDPDVVTAEQNGSPVFGLLAQLLRTRESFQLQQMSRVDSYRNITRIGEGATYVVDKRTDLESEDQLIAVKTAKFTVPKGAGYMITINSPEFRRLKSVLLEVEILAHPPLQSHPNIPDLLGIAWDVDSPGFTPQLVMELATHGSLSSFLKTNRLSDTEQIDCCLDIAQALETLHKCMIVHGDVKQDNVLVFPHTERRIVTKLSDFEHAVLRTDKLCYLGTQIYNAPEVHRVKNGKAAFTHFKELFACDAFAFGLLVFEIFLGGRRYFSVDDGQLFQDMLFDTSWGQYSVLCSSAPGKLIDKSRSNDRPVDYSHVTPGISD
jgi:serine/threonine protein kinase